MNTSRRFRIVRSPITGMLAFAMLAGAQHLHAAGQSSANFTISRDVINAGGDDMASANFLLKGSVGDSVSTGALASGGFVLNSGYRAQLDISVPSMLSLISVFSRKVHGAAGTFDMPIDLAQVISGAVTVEPRAIGAGHAIVFQFNNTITAAGTATALDSSSQPIGSAVAAASGNEVVVTLTGVPDNRRLTLGLTGVNGSTNASAAMGFLVGDVNNSRSVNATDIAGIKARSGQATAAASYRFDLNASGGINATDIAAVKARSGLVLP
jgi:Dockerin type I domain